MKREEQRVLADLRAAVGDELIDLLQHQRNNRSALAARCADRLDREAPLFV